jgi:tRNA U38,U39,U40 pseudouridine synthase TruA
MCYFCFVQDAGVHALSNVCHVDVERISKRKPGEVVCTPSTTSLHVLLVTYVNHNVKSMNSI